MKTVKQLVVQQRVIKRERERQPDRLDYPTVLAGYGPWRGNKGEKVGVLYDPALGVAGTTSALALLGTVSEAMRYCDTVFGVSGRSGNAIIVAIDGNRDGSGGAYHWGCGFDEQVNGGSDWYICQAEGNPALVHGFAMAEISESYMGLAGTGWDCGGSGGEGLSRFLATISSGGPGGAFRDWQTGPRWDGGDWVSKDSGSDTHMPSVACAVLYLWWLNSLGFTPSQIAQAGEPDGTLASNYQALTGKAKSNAYGDLMRAVQAVGGPTSDNPWGWPTPLYPLPPAYDPAKADF